MDFTQVIGHVQELIDSNAAGHESSVLSGFFCHFDLPKPTLQVHASEVLGANHAPHGLLHPRHGVGILLGSGIQAAEVNAKLE